MTHLVARTLFPKSCLLLASVALLASPLSACRSRSTSSNRTSSPQALVVLGTAESFAVLAGEAITNTGPSVLTGNVGVSPGSAVTGFPPGIVVGGTIHTADAVALQAQLDNASTYTFLAGQACTHDLTGTDLGGLTLTAGVYCLSTSAQLTGTLTLDAEGDPNALFIFQIGSTLTTASNSSVVLINGARSCNVFWQVGSSATVGTTTRFIGNILALASITVTTGATITGRALAQNGAVTLDSNVITHENCGEVTDGGTGGRIGRWHRCRWRQWRRRRRGRYRRRSLRRHGLRLRLRRPEHRHSELRRVRKHLHGRSNVHGRLVRPAVHWFIVPVWRHLRRFDDRSQQLRQVRKHLCARRDVQRRLLRNLPWSVVRKLVRRSQHRPQPLRQLRQPLRGQ